MASGKDIIGPFRIAMSGLVYTFRTQRHMRIHIYVTLIAVLGALLLNLRMRELLVLLLMIGFVIVAEMFNSAIEATVDLVSPNYNPLAKFAKDIAAGAVLITTIMAVIIGALLALGDDTWDRIRTSLTADNLGIGIVPRIFLGCFLVILVVVIGKGLGKRGQVLKGGLVSGHAALGFFLAGAIFFITDNALAASIGLLLACIIAQSRWEAKIHSIFELTLGATVGVLLSLIMFGLIPK